MRQIIFIRSKSHLDPCSVVWRLLTHFAKSIQHSVCMNRMQIKRMIVYGFIFMLNKSFSGNLVCPLVRLVVPKVMAGIRKYLKSGFVYLTPCRMVH